MRSHRSNVTDVHEEMAGRALVGAMSRVRKATGDAWNWHSPAKNHLNDPTAMIMPRKAPARAATSVPGKRGQANLSRRPQTSTSSTTSKSVLKQVLASNQRLREQIGTIRNKLVEVNDVMDTAEVIDEGPRASGWGSERSRSTRKSSSFDKLHSSRMKQTILGNKTNDRSQYSNLPSAKKSTTRSAPVGHPSRFKLREPPTCLTYSRGGPWGPHSPPSRPTKFRAPRGLVSSEERGENGQMRPDGKTTVNFCPTTTSKTHRLSHEARTINIKALGDVWKENPEIMNISQWESFRLPNTRTELQADDAHLL